MAMNKITKGYPNWDVPYNENVEEYNNTIGNVELDTEDKTIKGAINEVKNNLDNIKENEQINAADISNLKTSVANNAQSIGDINSQMNDKANKDTIVNNCNTTEEGFILDARQGKTLYDMLNRIIIKKIYPTFTNGVATINLTGATDTTPVIISNNHSSINSVSVAGVIPSTDTVKIRLSDTSINGVIGMTLIAKL